MKTTLQALTEARELIEKPENWVQGWGNGEQTRCAAHACCIACGGMNHSFFGGDAQRALNEACGSSIGRWNDEHSHSEVLAIFDKAIEAERAKASA